MQVIMPDNSIYQLSTLLSNGDSNTKLYKSNSKSKDYITYGLSLAPYNLSGYQVCASASHGCSSACLFYAGRGNYDSVKNARIARTRLFYQNRAEFKSILYNDLQRAHKSAQKQNKILAVRLNVLSDLKWEQIFPDIFIKFSNVQFYDYTKHFKRMTNKIPQNYHLTFSRNENNEKKCLEVLSKGKNVAVVFGSNLPTKWNNFPVVNGDETDLRFLDGNNVVCGLKAKGRARKDTSGFVEYVT